MPPHKPLTDSAARALRPSANRYDVPDGRVAGLVLSVLPSTLKQWTLRYRTQGKRRRLILGEYGDVPKTSSHDVRRSAQRAVSDPNGSAAQDIGRVVPPGELSQRFRLATSQSLGPDS